MSNLLHFEYTTGHSLYAVCVADNGQLDSVNGNGLQDYYSGNWLDSAIPMTEGLDGDSGNGKYFGCFTGDTAARYTAMFFNSPSPSISDALLGSYRFDYDGQNIVIGPNLPTLPITAGGQLWGSIDSTHLSVLGTAGNGSVDLSGQTILMTTGAATGLARTIVAHNLASQILTVSPPCNVLPGIYDEYVIFVAATGATPMDLVSAPNPAAIAAWPTAAGIASAVWNALTSALTTAGSIGWKLANAVFGGGGSVTVAGYASGQDPATLLAASTTFLNAVAGASQGQGTGSIAVNQNTGGTDNLRYVDAGGNGVGDAEVLIYLATDWPANPDRVQAAATTGPDGRWLSPAFVNSGTYVAVFTKLGADGPDASAPFTV